MLRFDRKQQNSVKQLPFNKKKIFLRKKRNKVKKKKSYGIKWKSLRFMVYETLEERQELTENLSFLF